MLIKTNQIRVRRFDVKIEHFESHCTPDWLGEVVSLDTESDWKIRTDYGVLLHRDDAVRDGLPRTYNRDCAVYIPGNNYLPHNPSNWDHVSTSDRNDVIEKYGSLEDADIECTIQDYCRWLDFVHGKWQLIDIVVSLSFGDIGIISSSLSGVESDVEEYVTEVESELIAQCFDEAHKAIPMLESVIDAIRSLQEEQ